MENQPGRASVPELLRPALHRRDHLPHVDAPTQIRQTIDDELDAAREALPNGSSSAATRSHLRGLVLREQRVANTNSRGPISRAVVGAGASLVDPRRLD